MATTLDRTETRLCINCRHYQARQRADYSGRRQMQTQIIIQHDTVEALKLSELWKQISELMFAEGPLSVIMVGMADEDETEDVE